MLIIVVTILTLLIPTEVFGEWKLEEMNTLIDQTNFNIENRCSGTLINIRLRLILTNYHCIVLWSPYGQKKIEQKEVLIKQPAYSEEGDLVGEISYKAKVFFYKEKYDLALLQIIAERIPHTKQATLLPDNKKVQRGERVFIVGNPNNLFGSVVEGIISSTTRKAVSWIGGEPIHLYQFSGGNWYGNSGGALYNAEGYLIGVPTVFSGTPHLGFAIPVKTIKQFLKESQLQLYETPKVPVI